MSTGTTDAVVFYLAEKDDEMLSILRDQDAERIWELGVDMQQYGDQGLYVLVIERGIEPYKNMLALPGGHIDEGERPEQAAKRELQEETGLNPDIVRAVETFENTDSVFDPRYDPEEKLPDDEPEDLYLDESYEKKKDPGFSYYTSVMRFEPEKKTDFNVHGGDDASRAFWVPVETLPKMAFLSHRVIRQAQEYCV